MPTEKYFAALTRFRDAVIPRRWQRARMTPPGRGGGPRAAGGVVDGSVSTFSPSPT